MHRDIWQSEALQFLVVTGLFTTFGINTGHALLGFCAGLVTVLVMSYRRSHQFYRWLNDRNCEKPTGSGYISSATSIIQRSDNQLKKVIANTSRRLEQLNQGLESLNDGILVLDGAGYIINLNSSAQLYFNLRPHDRGQQVCHLVRHPSFVKYLNRADYSEPLQFDIESTSLLIHITEFGGDQRLLLIRDVTERRRVETMRQNFIADVSHELRTPLTVINGYLELLDGQLEQLPEPLQPALHNMHMQGQRMASLVNDLIELSKLESVTRERPSEQFNLSDLCHRTIDQLSTLRQGCQLKLMSINDVVVDGFESEFASAVSNLIANAVKYGDGQQVDVVLAKHRNGVEFSVTDYGAGIEPKHLDHLTERFYRVDSSRESKVGGTGLGLAIVKHALENHDTQLAIESALGKGSRFSFVIPAARIINQ